MNQKANEKFIVLVTSIGAVALMVESLLIGWEFWAPIPILIGIVIMWWVNLSERVDLEIRKGFYFVFSFLIAFYHGVHKTSLFDIALVVVLYMVIYSILRSVYMMNLFFMEYFFLLFVQLINLPGGEPIPLDKLTVTRLLLYVLIVFLVYFVTTRTINERLEEDEEARKREERIETNDVSMEDFLSNISHELRTPVNVVNGMSDLLIKKGVGEEADAIRNAGVRLAYQIEDIQDYTECKRRKVFLEEDNYMSTSLINDVVSGFRILGRASELELVVDLDPKTPAMMKGDIKKLHKIFRHLLENAVKFTRVGGIYIRMYAEPMDYGVNLCIEMTDTGIGMDRKDIASVTEGMFQANKKRNRSSGGVGLGLYIVYGFVHRMGGFVKIESEKNAGTTVRVTIPQTVVNGKPCLSLEDSFRGAVLFHVKPDKYKVPKLRDFYRSMAANLASGMRVPLYGAETVYEVERLKEKIHATHIFMGEEEYKENLGYFEELAKEDIIVVVSAGPDFRLPENSRVLLMPKPLYGYPAIKILNQGRAVDGMVDETGGSKPVLNGVKALIVDDEPMNLVVATSLFREYGMVIETAGSGKESIKKFREKDYDVIFMDHMMPEMDGVEAMRQIKAAAQDLDRKIRIVALTANAVSGAREMFIREGFDGFIAKPISTADFERVMQRVFPESVSGRGGEKG